MSSLIVLVPQSIAATVSASPASLIGRPTHGPGRPPVAQLVEHLVAERVDPAALRRAPAPASTCRHLTRSGMPPAEMPSISGTSPSWRRARPGSARARRVRRGQLGVVAEPLLHLLHQRRRPRGCRSATRPAGRSGRRSSGTACRRAAAARCRPRRAARRGSGAPTAWIAARRAARAGRPTAAVVGRDRSRLPVSPASRRRRRSSVAAARAPRPASAGRRPARTDSHAVGPPRGRRLASDGRRVGAATVWASSGLPSSPSTTYDVSPGIT